MELLRSLSESDVCAIIKADSKSEFLREIGRHFDALPTPSMVKVIFYIDKEGID